MKFSFARITVLALIPFAVSGNIAFASEPETMKWQDYEQPGYMATQSRQLQSVELALTNTLQKLNESGTASGTMLLSLLERLVMVCANQRKYSAATEYCKLALRFAESEKNPKKTATLYACMGNLQRAELKFTESELSYNRALKLFPNAPALLYGLARLKVDANQPQEARRIFEQAMQLETANGMPPSPADLMRYAQACYKLGDYDAAQRSLEQAMAVDRKELGDNHPVLAAELNDLAVVLKAKNQVPSAQRNMRDALAICRKYRYTDLPDWSHNLQLIEQPQ